VGASDNERKKFLVGMVMDRNINVSYRKMKQIIQSMIEKFLTTICYIDYNIMLRFSIYDYVQSCHLFLQRRTVTKLYTKYYDLIFS
jgi:hypothetical protein